MEGGQLVYGFKGNFLIRSRPHIVDAEFAAVSTNASRNSIGRFDARRYANRHLIVHHKADSCPWTTFSAAKASHEIYGTEFIAMEGGISVGDRCEAFSHHGFNGIERETVEAIKKWIRQGG